MKKKKNLVVLVIVFAALLMVLWGVEKWNDAQAELDEQEKENAKIYAFETENLEKIVYMDASENVWAFEWDGEAWKYTLDPEIPLSQDDMEEMAQAFSKIEAVKELENPDALSDYGFDEPQYQLELTADGSQSKWLVGDTVGECYYFMEEGADRIYTISNTFTNEMVWELGKVAEQDVFPYIATDEFESVTISKADGTEVTYDVSDEEQKETAESIASSVAVTYFTNCANYHVSQEALAEYGLDDNSRTTVTIKYNDGEEKEAVLYVGNLDEDEEYYYVQLEDSKKVNRVLKDSVEAIIG